MLTVIIISLCTNEGVRSGVLSDPSKPNVFWPPAPFLRDTDASTSLPCLSAPTTSLGPSSDIAPLAPRIQEDAGSSHGGAGAERHTPLSCYSCRSGALPSQGMSWGVLLKSSGDLEMGTSLPFTRETDKETEMERKRRQRGERGERRQVERKLRHERETEARRERSRG